MTGSKKHALQGLDALGSRLREIRIKAKISQMKLAELLGLNPTHGYKYILRLEKGLVPNPTLRTITGFLAACGATWKDIADVLPSIGINPAAESKPTPSEPVIIPPAKSSIEAISWVGALPDESGVKKLFSEQFWRQVKIAQDHIWDLLRISHQTGVKRRHYFTFVRSVCALIAQFNTDPKALNSALKNISQRAAKQGLEPQILNQIKQVCLKIFGAKNLT